MAKTALLAQNDNLAIDALKQKVGRSVFDLSHTFTIPVDVDGAIYPICDIETVPSDAFEINTTVLLRQLSSLKVPLMTRFIVNVAFYYCDNRLGWKHWERFMSGGRSGNEVFDVPRCANTKTTVEVEGEDVEYYSLVDGSTKFNYKNNIHTYFGISLNRHSDTLTQDDSEELPLAMSFFDYQMICRDNYTDIDRLPENPASGSDFYDYDDIDSDWAYSNLFPPDEDEIRLADGVQLKSGYHTDISDNTKTVGFCLDKMRYHNVRDDYFVTSKKAPMRGDIPTVDTTVATSSIDATDVVYSDENHGAAAAKAIGINGTAAKLGVVLNPGSTNFDLSLNSSSNLNASIDKIKSNNQPLIDALQKLKVNLETTKAISAAELRLLSQLTVWQELNMLHKPTYNDFLNAHFNGVKVGDADIEAPQFIGSHSQIVSINEVTQTSSTASGGALGNIGASAHSVGSGNIGKYFCNNYGHIIGVMYILPDLYYDPAIPRQYSRRTKEDFYSPEFANLSMQAILNKEIFFSNSDEWNNQVWGYTGAYDELRSIPNRIGGDLLNDAYTDLQAWVLRRPMANDNKPSMSSKWLSAKGNVDMTAWNVPEMPKFMCQVANYIKAVRPMPFVAIPKAL